MKLKRLAPLCMALTLMTSAACAMDKNDEIYIVKTKTVQASSKGISCFTSAGINVKNSKVYSDTGLICVTVDGKDSDKIERLKNSSHIEWIEKAAKRYLKGQSYEGKQWYLKNDGNSDLAEELSDESWKVSSLTPGVDLAIEEAWKVTSGDEKVIVAVMDSGVDYKHRDLSSAMWINKAEKEGTEGVDDDGNGYIDDIYGCNGNRLFFPDKAGDPMDDSGKSGHGTHVAGLIAASKDDRGIVGVAPKVKIMGLRVADEKGELITPAIVEAANYLIDQIKKGVNVKVVNMSFGGPVISRAEREVIEKLEELGVLVVIAAGNEGGDMDYYPANYPAMLDCPNIVTVGAIDGEGKIAPFSQRGRAGLDVFAPGYAILSTMADAAPLHDRDYIQRRDGLDFEEGQKADGPDIDGWGVMSGTSMSAPLVSGVAALMFSTDDQISWREVKSSILQSVSEKDCLKGRSRSNGFLKVQEDLVKGDSPVILGCHIDSSSRSFSIYGDNLDDIESFRLGELILSTRSRTDEEISFVWPDFAPKDPSTSLKGLSNGGDSTLPLMWVNQGTKEDYPTVKDYTFMPYRGSVRLGEKVYGIGLNGAGTVGLYSLDPETNEIKSAVRLDSEGMKGDCMTMASLGEKLYLYGGNTQGTIYVYDPNLNIIKTIGDVTFPFDGFLKGHSMASDGEYIYISGGMLFSEGNDFLADQIALLRWKPSMDSWEIMGDMPDLPDGRTFSTMTVCDDKVVIAGGFWQRDGSHYGEMDRVDIFDIEDRSWSQGKLPFSGQNGHADLIGDKLYVWGLSNLGNISPYIAYSPLNEIDGQWKVLNRTFSFDGAKGQNWTYEEDEQVRLMGESFSGDRANFTVSLTSDTSQDSSSGGCNGGFTPSLLLLTLPLIMNKIK